MFTEIFAVFRRFSLEIFADFRQIFSRIFAGDFRRFFRLLDFFEFLRPSLPRRGPRPKNRVRRGRIAMADFFPELQR